MATITTRVLLERLATEVGFLAEIAHSIDENIEPENLNHNSNASRVAAQQVDLLRQALADVSELLSVIAENVDPKTSMLKLTATSALGLQELRDRLVHLEDASFAAPTRGEVDLF